MRGRGLIKLHNLKKAIGREPIEQVSVMSAVAPAVLKLALNDIHDRELVRQSLNNIACAAG
jgi:hypothetical protein